MPQEVKKYIPEDALIAALHRSPRLSCDERVAILRKAQQLASLLPPPGSDAVREAAGYCDRWAGCQCASPAMRAKCDMWMSETAADKRID